MDDKTRHQRVKAPPAEFEGFAFRLLDIDDLGLYCSDDVKEEARRLLGMPPHPKSILLKPAQELTAVG